MYGGYYTMDGMPFGKNNMRPMLGSMYEFPLMPSQPQPMLMQPPRQQQPTPFYNPHLFNVNNSNYNNNNNFSNSSYVPHRVPSIHNILHVDNSNNTKNNDSKVMLYNVNTRNTGGNNVERNINAMNDRNGSNLNYPMSGSGYGSFFGAEPPLGNRTSSNLSSIGVRSLPRISSGVNFNYSYNGYDNSYGNANSEFSSPRTHNNNISSTVKVNNNNNNNYTNSSIPSNRTTNPDYNTTNSTSNAFQNSSLIRYNSKSNMAPVQRVPAPQRNVSNMSQLSRAGSMSNISLVNLPPSYYNLNSFHINVNEPSTNRIGGTGGSFSNGLPGMGSGVSVNGSPSSFYSETGSTYANSTNNRRGNAAADNNNNNNTVNRNASCATNTTSSDAASFDSSFASSFKSSNNSNKGFTSKANEINTTHPLERLDSSSALHRQFSIAGQFNEFQSNNNCNNYNGIIPLPVLSQRYGMYPTRSPSTSSSFSVSTTSTPFGVQVNEGNEMYSSLRGPRPSTLPNLSTHNTPLSTRSQSMPLNVPPDNTFVMRNAAISENMVLNGTSGSLLPLVGNNNSNMSRFGFQPRMTNVPVLPSSSSDWVGSQRYSNNFTNSNNVNANVNNNDVYDNGNNKNMKGAPVMSLGRSGSLLNFRETETMPLPNDDDPFGSTTNNNNNEFSANINLDTNSNNDEKRFVPLIRTSSEKRVGMYFKNVEASNTDDKIQYKKEGDVVDEGKRTSRVKDTSLTNNIKPLLLLATSNDISTHHSPSRQEKYKLKAMNVRVEVDGRTLRVSTTSDTENENFMNSTGDVEEEQVTKYDMREIVSVNRESDVEVSCEALDEVRDAFAYGCNGGLIMADSNGPGALPTRWFTWRALKSLMKAVFARTSHTLGRELSMSVCLIQDDVVMDLLADEPRSFIPLVVAESPLFGNVVNGAEYLYIDDAAEFNDTLDLALERAEKVQADNISGRNSGNSISWAERNADSKYEERAHVYNKGDDGIVVVICVLKQLKTLRDDAKDVVISSLFASGVGDGILHYARIMDKNPAEPRQLFYSAMHRAVHCLGMFSCNEHEPDFVEYIQILNRLGEVNIRPPKTGSTASFVRYSKQSITKMEEDIANAKDPRQKIMMQRYLDKLRLMLSDAEFMLENPESAIPKTYI